jgi:hypothetical protein
MDERDLTQQVTTMPDEDLRDTRRDLEVGIALLRPGSPMHGPAAAYLTAVESELARRAAGGSG